MCLSLYIYRCMYTCTVCVYIYIYTYVNIHIDLGGLHIQANSTRGELPTGQGSSRRSSSCSSAGASVATKTSAIYIYI